MYNINKSSLSIFSVLSPIPINSSFKFFKMTFSSHLPVSTSYFRYSSFFNSSVIITSKPYWCIYHTATAFLLKKKKWMLYFPILKTPCYVRHKSKFLRMTFRVLIMWIQPLFSSSFKKKHMNFATLPICVCVCMCLYKHKHTLEYTYKII